MTSRVTAPSKTVGPKPTPRGCAVLSAIISEHLLTGDAVGSHALSDRFEHAAGWSSATIRYVMGELEDSGLLEQPHTSAGRIPTDKGYRFYVDHIIGDTRLSRGDRRVIERLGSVGGARARPDRLMEEASHVLSALSENVGIVVWPPLAENRLRHIKFLRLPDKRVLVVLVSTSNIVQDKVILLDQDFSQDELDRTARYLNTEFSGKSLLTIRAEIIALMREEKALYDRLLRNAMLLCEGSLIDEDTSGEVYVDGASNILTKPEFASAERMRELFRMFEEKSRLVNVLNECVAGDHSSGEVKVVIGRENLAPSMKNCAVITASYKVSDDICGNLGVVGPTRIEYARMMAVVNYLARFIERALSHEASLH